MEQRVRIAYIDIAKTICIFLMVVGHWTSNSILLMYIYSFHMPALFIISGFLYKPHSWKRTILSFGIPVVFYSIINIGFLFIDGEFMLNSVLSKEVFFRLFHYRYGLGEGLFTGDWFIWALLGLRLFFGDINNFSFFRKYYIIFSVLVIVYMSFEAYLINIDYIFRGWYIGRFIPSLPFFCFGFFLNEKRLPLHNIPIYLVISSAIAFIFLPLLNGSCSINSNEYGLSYSLFYINAIVSTIFVFAVSNIIPPNQFATTISKGTLLILGLHIPIMKILDAILSPYFDFIIPVITILICFFPIKWFDKWCPCLLGRIR